MTLCQYCRLVTLDSIDAVQEYGRVDTFPDFPAMTESGCDLCSILCDHFRLRIREWIAARGIQVPSDLALHAVKFCFSNENNTRELWQRVVPDGPFRVTFMAQTELGATPIPFSIFADGGLSMWMWHVVRCHGLTTYRHRS